MNSPDELKKQFEMLYRDYGPMVMQIALGYMKGDAVIAADLTQEVFINIWNALAKFRGASSYKTWIYRITVNTCLLYLRSASKRKILYPGTEVALDLSESPDHSADQHKTLYRAIGALEEFDRLIVMMMLDEMSYEDMAQITGLKEGNIRVKLHRLKTKIREIYNSIENHG
jgi:RNA polymerase sigma-70 factor (ECF subfamily)